MLGQPVVGLTGGIATGKSTVSDLLKARKIALIDADILARRVVEPGTPALAKIVTYFGPDILLSDGSLDRKRLGSIIFNDETKRRKLNSIVHPAVRRAMGIMVLRHWVKGEKYCIVDVPLLIEGGIWKWVGKVVVVYCSAEIQLQRLIQRDGSSLDEASSRLNSQLPIAEKVNYADLVIDNSGSYQDLEVQVSSFVEKLEKEAGWTALIGWIIPIFACFSAMWLLMRRGLRRRQKAARKYMKTAE